MPVPNSDDTKHTHTQKFKDPPGQAESNWVWSPQYQIAMHQPETWGYVQFADAPGVCGLLCVWCVVLCVRGAGRTAASSAAACNSWLPVFNITALSPTRTRKTHAPPKNSK